MTDTPITPVVPLDKEEQKLKKDIEAAKLIQKQLAQARTKDRRSTSPRVQMARQFESPRDKWVNREYPEANDKHADRKNPTKVTTPATIKVMFDAPDLHDLHIAEGWEPIIRDGAHFRERGDLGYTMPIELYREPKIEAANAATIAAQSVEDDIKAQNAKLPREVEE